MAEHSTIFENNGAFASPEQKIAIHMRSSSTRTILELLKQRPGIHQAELAGILRISAPTVIWHIRKLERDGFVKEERQGKTIRYTLTPNGALVLGKFQARIFAAYLTSRHKKYGIVPLFFFEDSRGS